ncbi:MAG TPA: outer membrane protein assembly factor BamA [Gammaproteobacteria bacterium]|nr:outer membrane protein assembly factor BamA [Gammaproteobacteria bacterium]HCZ48602.1 outer membrane protein assembly factor BamA [Gammaproteobacteria bacterium]MCH78040.1 outer membrane protein assembly factor BamA [Gammaproteobacteria bacterium]
MSRCVLALVLCLSLVPSTVRAVDADGFVVEDIRLNGLQRISPGAVLIALPVRVGDRFDPQRSSDVIRALFQTEFFSDVQLGRDGDVLVIDVVERPSIAELNITGNKDIKTEDLQKGLREAGLAVGRVFVPSALDQLRQELQRQYFANGKYGMDVETEVADLPRNRVRIDIVISEGDVARIRQINIVGNQVFDDDTLRNAFELSTPNLLSFITGNDKYSRQKLAGDLEKLHAYYLDRGYLDFDITSTQVAITPDKREIYITINVDEGQQYTVDEVKLSGNLVVEPEELVRLVTLRPGDVFSRKAMTETSDAISERLGEAGYAFANVNGLPEVDTEKASTKLTFFVDPGKRAYVRRISFAGNQKTADEVMRREMRQMESATFSSAAVERSRVRLERLGFFEDVTVETPAVPGSPDQVDVNFTVKERASGSISAGVGFGQGSGLLLNAAVTQNNFLGTGDSVSVNFSNSDYARVYSVAHTNPYATVDGVSRSVSAFLRTTDAADANLTEYDTDSFGGSWGYNVPLSEFSAFGFGLAFENTKIGTGDFTSQDVLDFIADNGDSYNIFKLNLSLARDTRNRAIFPDRGALRRLSGEIAAPLGDLQFYKLNFTEQHYFPFSDTVSLMVSGTLGYGDGYGDTTALPFFENFFAGGFRTLRGFKDNTLGPRTFSAFTDSDGDPFGGDRLILARSELFFPVPFMEQQSKNFRLSVFADAGNVFGPDDSLKVGELRYSTGMAAVWISPFGAISIAIAQPFNEGPQDETQRFQFSLGAGF